MPNAHSKNSEIPEDFEVRIKFSVLQRIAEYYQFPCAVFFVSSAGDFPQEKTREESIAKIAKEFEQEIKNLVKKYCG